MGRSPEKNGKESSHHRARHVPRLPQMDARSGDHHEIRQAQRRGRRTHSRRRRGVLSRLQRIVAHRQHAESPRSHTRKAVAH